MVLRLLSGNTMVRKSPIAPRRCNSGGLSADDKLRLARSIEVVKFGGDGPDLALLQKLSPRRRQMLRDLEICILNKPLTSCNQTQKDSKNHAQRDRSGGQSRARRRTAATPTPDTRLSSITR